MEAMRAELSAGLAAVAAIVTWTMGQIRPAAAVDDN